MIFSVEGNIGCGKSTVLAAVERLANMGAELPIDVEYEPVNEWTRPVLDGDRHMLGEFYRDMRHNCLAFQLYVLHTRFEQYNRVLSMGPGRATVIERSLETDRLIFARQNITEPCWRHAYEVWFNHVRDQLRPLTESDDSKLVFYLRCDPSKCLERVLRRRRDTESDITLEYLTRLHDLHEAWVHEQSNVIVIDTTGDGEYAVDETATTILKEVMRYFTLSRIGGATALGAEGVAAVAEAEGERGGSATAAGALDGGATAATAAASPAELGTTAA
jgi:deoxyadenosine/deoxycytidine kinase